MTRTLSILILLALAEPALAHETTPVEKVVTDAGYQLSQGLGDGTWTPVYLVWQGGCIHLNLTTHDWSNVVPAATCP